MQSQCLYDHNDMAQWKRYVYYPVTLFRNIFINKIPGRHFRRFIDRLLGAGQKIGERTKGLDYHVSTPPLH